MHNLLVEDVGNFQIERKGWHGGFHATGVDCIHYSPFAFKVFSHDHQLAKCGIAVLASVLLPL